MRNVTACALAVALALAARGLAAAQAKTALSWVRAPDAESCIGAPELGRRIEKLVGPVLAAAPEGEISIEGGIHKSRTGYEATLAVSDASGRLLGRRTVRSDNPDCRTLDDQIAFVIAVAIDPNAALAELPGELAEDTHPEAELLSDLQAHPPHPAPLPERVEKPRASAAETSSARAGIDWRFGGSLGAAGGLGMMPSASAGVTAALSVWTDAWSHHLRGTYWWPQRSQISSGNEVEFGLPELALVTCPQLWAGADLRLAACAGVAVARMTVDPRGFDGTAHARWLVGPQLSVRLARQLTGPIGLVLWLGAESLWPHHRIDYELSGEPQTIRELPVLMGRADLSLELRF